MPRKNPPETPLYVKLPTSAVEKLDRASAELGVSKKQLVTTLVAKYIDPREPVMGTYSFQPYDPPEVMSSAQAAQFLQIDEKNVIELAEAGKLPGKKLGPVWRFSRDALVAWLSAPEEKRR